MSYVALYRKFRPGSFDAVKGQDHVVRTLKNQILNNRVGHAYLFTGTRGTGKTSVAKLLAKAVNCLDLHDGEPCGKCENCRAADSDSFMDVVEVDAASNTSVDDIRRIIEEVRYAPIKGRYKVYIIDEVHMLSNNAFNAFLKTLEEPPSYAVFILATTEPHKLPITVLSRCQRYDFHRIDNDTITANLAMLMEQEGIGAEPKALKYIAKMGDGSMRDSISLLDKCIAFSLGEDLTYEKVLDTLGTVDTEVFSETFRAVASGDAAAALSQIEKAVNGGRDLTQFINDFIWYLRNLLLVGVSGETADILGVSAENMELLKADAGRVSGDILMRYIRILSELINSMRYAVAKQILAEMAFIKLAKPQMEADVQSLADRIRQLEERGVAAPAAVSRAVTENPAAKAPESRPAQSAPAPAPAAEPAKAPAVKEPAEDQGFFGIDYMDISDEMLNPDFGEPAENHYSEPESDAEEEFDPDQFTLDFGAAQKPAAESHEVPEAPVSQQTDDGTVDWNAVINASSSFPVRIALKNAAYRVGDEGQLFIYAQNQNTTYGTIKDHEAEIKSAIKAVTGVDYNIIINSGAAPAGHEPKAQPKAPDNREEFFRNINFNIGTEEI